MIGQAVQAGLIISLFVYAIFRLTFYEFPMTTVEEILYFSKIVLSCVFVVTTVSTAAALLYSFLLNLVRRKLVR